ncbi:TPA: 3-hydroxybutyryl-CoA dehydrogenase [Candidatus Sumerlaeota bacterium]|jgi:3-hydroxybutyryl-CoA dehydrogenase|nr:3-hydroxybutyryl-CoA dehydrogenase [Candidatus Sumerlaeota bacterium]
MRLTKLGVVGAGTMGKGIIRCAAGCGLSVVFCEQTEELVQNALKDISDAMDYEISRWGLTSGEKRLIMTRIEGTTDLRNLAGSQAIIEATAGNTEDKQKIFEDMDALFPEETVLISNSSTVAISEIAKHCKLPQRTAVMRFSHPVYQRPIVEVSRGHKTSDAAMSVVAQLAKVLKKKVIEVLEMPGLVTTRVMVPYINEAMQIVMEGIVSAPEVDEAIRLGFKLPVGPLAMADRIGLDTLLKDMERLFRTMGLLQYRPCPILRRMVRQGHLGVKTGRGFFLYDEHGNITGAPSDACCNL